MFDKKNIDIDETVEARKEKIDEARAWELMRGADEIVVSRGKNILVFQPSEKNRTEIMGHSLGRTGNLRAPTLKINNRFVVGFNEEMYDTYVA